MLWYNVWWGKRSKCSAYVLCAYPIGAARSALSGGRELIALSYLILIIIIIMITIIIIIIITIYYYAILYHHYYHDYHHYYFHHDYYRYAARSAAARGNCPPRPPSAASEKGPTVNSFQTTLAPDPEKQNTATVPLEWNMQVLQT